MPGVYLFRVVAVLSTILLSGPAHALVLKIATLSPDGSGWMQKMREGAAEVAQVTDDRVRFKFFPGGVMGNDRAVLRKIRIGQLHGGAFPGGTLSGSSGEAQVYSLPMKFKSFGEIDYVRKQMDSRIIADIENGGFVTFGLAEGGFAYVMSNAPVRDIDALRKQKVWIPAHDRSILETMKGFGINPIALPIADVRTGLQTGLIDTVAISPVAAIVLQWHTQVKYLTELPLAYLYGLLAVDQKTFNRISSEDQKAVRRIMGSVFREMDRMNREDNVKALEALRQQGIQFVKPPPETEGEWQNIASAISSRLIEKGNVTPDIVRILEGHLNDYRSQQAATGG